MNMCVCKKRPRRWCVLHHQTRIMELRLYEYIALALCGDVDARNKLTYLFMGLL